MAEFVAAHLGHHDVADHEGGDAVADEGKGLAAVARGDVTIAMPLENVFQLLRLRGAILHDEDFDLGVR